VASTENRRKRGSLTPSATPLRATRRSGTRTASAEHAMFARLMNGQLDLDGSAFMVIGRAGSLERAESVRHGLSPRVFVNLAASLRLPQTTLLDNLGLPHSTMKRKAQHDELLGRLESERVMGVARLVGLVQSMVEESGESESFDAAQWLGQWIQVPVPALGGRTPADMLDTAAGQEEVARLLRQAQAGVYA